MRSPAVHVDIGEERAQLLEGGCGLFGSGHERLPWCVQGQTKFT
jgi:hypothetical protein